jgi:hypothetical protein
MGRETIMNFKIIELLKAPKWIRRLGRYVGLILSLGWLGYVAHVCVSSRLGWPDRDDQLDIAFVAIVLFVVGWAFVRLGFRALDRMHSAISVRNNRKSIDGARPELSEET